MSHRDASRDRGVEIPCPTCPTREIFMTDKWNFPAELPGGEVNISFLP